MNVRGPRFDELVGDDLAPAERERMLRVHDLLIEAGPPPDLAPAAPTPLSRRRRRGALIAIAAALAVAVFTVGAAIGNRAGDPSSDFAVAMVGTDAAPEAAASLTVFDLDEAGNWPMKMTVERLAPAPSGRPFELWLTKDGHLAALCGAFRTDADGFAKVPMNAPYTFSDFDGWIVVEEGSTKPLLTT